MGELQFSNNNEVDFTKWNDEKKLDELQSENLETLSRWKLWGKHHKKYPGYK